MAKLEWDTPAASIFRGGVSNGVLYVNRNRAVPWNGLTSVTVSSNNPSHESIYLDGIKIGSYIAPDEPSVTVSAYTYPDELDWFQGIRRFNGLGLYSQLRPDRFHISWKTQVIDSEEKVRTVTHILYNCSSLSPTFTYNTHTNASAASTFSWTLECIPEVYAGLTPTAYVFLDDKYVSKNVIQDVEYLLYGTARTNPSLPSGDLLAKMVENKAALSVTKSDSGLNPVTYNSTGALVGSVNAGLYRAVDGQNISLQSNGLHRIT